MISSELVRGVDEIAGIVATSDGGIVLSRVGKKNCENLPKRFELAGGR